MIPRLRPTLGLRELLALVLPTRRGAVPAFEQAFARLMGQKHAIACPYGRTGLWLLLQALGLKDKEIICPAYTCVVVPHAIVHSGNEPVFIDSQVDDFNMNLDLARSAVTDRTGAIVATSIFGHPVNLDKLAAFRREFPHLRVIQDCAHSFAADWNGRPVQRDGDAAIFGMNISKLMTSIFGGMVTTEDDALAERLRELREEHCQRTGWMKGLKRRTYLAAVTGAFWGPVYTTVNWLERKGLLNRFVRYYDEGLIDMPADYLQDMSEFEAEIGIIQTRRYPDIIAHRRRLAAFYQDQLHDLNVQLPPSTAGATYSHFVVRTADRDRCVQYALRHGVQLGLLIDYSIPEMKAYRDRPGNRFACPIARAFVDQVINLPLSISPRQAGVVVAVLRDTLPKAARLPQLRVAA